MEEIKYVFDPQGDTILVLKNPDAPFAVWPYMGDQEWPDILQIQTATPNNEAEVTNGPANSETVTPEHSLEPAEVSQSPEKAVEIRMRVSSAHLILASSHFETMFKGPWKEAANGPPFEVITEDWDEHAFVHVMNIIHNRTRKVPRQVNLELLARIAVIVDYYQVLEAVEVFADIWLQDSKLSSPDPSGRQLSLEVLVSWIFKDQKWFTRLFRLVVLNLRGPLPSLGLPIPQKVIGKNTPALCVYG